MIVYVNGDFYDNVEEAKISVFDHGLLYGDGVFEGIRIYNGKAFELEAHLQRLYDSAKVIYLEIMPQTELIELVEKCIEKSKKSEGYIRLIITRGIGDLGVDPVTCKKASVIIIVDDISVYPSSYYERGIDIITSSYIRIPPYSLDVRIKSLNYLNNILAKMEARRQGVLEAVLLNKDGYVTECTGDNLFVIKDNILKTPICYQGILSGITRKVIFDIAKKLNISVKETILTRYDLYTADECFMSGTAIEIIPVISIDKNTVGDGNVGNLTKSIVREFRRYINIGEKE